MISRLAGGSDTAGVASLIVDLATVTDAPDHDALADMVAAVRIELVSSDRVDEFDDDLLSLLTSRLAWRDAGITSIDDILQHRKVHQT